MIAKIHSKILGAMGLALSIFSGCGADSSAPSDQDSPAGGESSDAASAEAGMSKSLLLTIKGRKGKVSISSLAATQLYAAMTAKAVPMSTEASPDNNPPQSPASSVVKLISRHSKTVTGTRFALACVETVQEALEKNKSVRRTTHDCTMLFDTSIAKRTESRPDDKGMMKVTDKLEIAEGSEIKNAIAKLPFAAVSAGSEIRMSALSKKKGVTVEIISYAVKQAPEPESPFDFKGSVTGGNALALYDAMTVAAKAVSGSPTKETNMMAKEIAAKDFLMNCTLTVRTLKTVVVRDARCAIAFKKSIGSYAVSDSDGFITELYNVQLKDGSKQISGMKALPFNASSDDAGISITSPSKGAVAINGFSKRANSSEGGEGNNPPGKP